jgi:glycosyltransferase involved in cell wall biosynthesis
MRILLVAYDFPPVNTPRALRWRYLARELVLLGHEVHVLAPDLGEPGVAFPASPGKFMLHRTWPGPFGGLVRRARRRTVHGVSGASRSSTPAGAADRSSSLNWRGRLVDRGKKLCGLVMYPDVRSEWAPWARHAMRRVLSDVRPDVVVTSHEPATTLPLGRLAQRLGFPWVADLGDPICASYTPRRWRNKAMRLEAMVCRQADAIVVTTDATRRLLRERHGDPHCCEVISNGYDDRRKPAQVADANIAFDPARLELIQAGRLYDYRDPRGLLEAVANTHDVRLTLIVPDPPQGNAGHLIRAAGDRIRVLGPMPHDRVMTALAAADVMVNLGNGGPSVQVPARVYEYLGIPRPILHVVTGCEEQDIVAQLLRPLQRGWIARDRPAELGLLLERLRQYKLQSRLHRGLALDPVEAYAHSALGRRFADLVTRLETHASS